MALINVKNANGMNITSITSLGKTDQSGVFSNVAVGDYIVLSGEKSFDPQISATGMDLIVSDISGTCKFYMYKVTSLPVAVTSGASTYLYAFDLK